MAHTTDGGADALHKLNVSFLVQGYARLNMSGCTLFLHYVSFSLSGHFNLCKEHIERTDYDCGVGLPLRGTSAL